MPTFFFLNKPFLLGLFAVAIPLLIHLFTRKKARKLSFSSVGFIRDLAKRETKRLRVRNLLLMVLRTAAIACFVLAMARPALVGPLARGKGSAAVVVVIDNSASMGALGGEKSLFSYAREATRRIFSGLDDGDEGGVIPVCGVSAGGSRDRGTRGGPREGSADGGYLDSVKNPTGGAYNAGLVAGPARLVKMVDLVDLSNGSSSPEKALAAGYSLLEGSKNINRELYVVSDFQRTQWRNLESSRTGRVPPRRGIKTFLIPVSLPVLGFPLENLSVERAGVVAAGSAEGQTLEFVVANHGRSVARGVSVRLLSGGKEFAVKYVDVEPGASVTAGLKLVPGPVDASSRDVSPRKNDPGETSRREIDVVIPPDVFPLDNTYFLATLPPRQTQVLIVGDEQPSLPGGDAGEGVTGRDFVSLALRPAPAGATGNIWGFIPHRIMTTQLGEGELRGAKCVILDNVSRLSGRCLDLLREYRNSGGKLLIVLGDRVDIRYYNERLLPALFPARLVGVEEASGGRGDGRGERETDAVAQTKNEGRGRFFSLVATIASHPILRSFDVSRGQAISGARFYRLIRAEGLEDTRVVAEFSRDLPAILEAKDAILFTSSFEPEWNDLVVSGGFLPLLHETLRYLCGGGSPVGRNFYPGDVLEEELPAGQETFVSLVDPAGKDLKISKNRTGASVVVRSEPMNELGIYRLFAGDEELSAFSVNVDPAESQLEPLNKRDLLKTFAGASIINENTRGEPAGVERPGQELWPLFLVLCLGLMVAELLVARSITPSE